MEVLGKTYLNMKINDKSHPFMFYVIEDLSCQGLIGLDFLLAYRGCLNAISPSEVTLSLDEKNCESKQREVNIDIGSKRNKLNRSTATE